MAKSVCKKKLILFLFLYKYHTTTTTTATTMAFFDTIDNMEFNRKTPVVRGEQFLPSIYIFSLGKVKELRESLSISAEHNDDSVVAKCGYTKDFTNTTETLKEKYDYIDNVDLQLLQHCFIDQKQIFKAEKEIRVKIGCFRYLEYNKGEFLIIPPYMKNVIPHIYRRVSQTFIGKNVFIMNKLREHELVLLLQKNRLEHTIEINKLDTEISIIKLERIINVQKKDMEIEKKDMEIEKNKFILEQHMKMKAMEQQILDQKIIIENMTKTQKNT